MLVSVLLTLASPLAAAAIALPGFRRGACDVSSAVVPDDNGSLTVPEGLHPIDIALGVGTQNYTCTNGKYATAGAVAILYDISCYYDSSDWDSHTEYPIGHHFFVTNPVNGTGINPEFIRDLDPATQGQPPLFSILAKVQDFPSPDSTDDVDWLRLDSFLGDWAATIFRVNTVGGQPPASCSASDPAQITVPYHAAYWFYK